MKINPFKISKKHMKSLQKTALIALAGLSMFSGCGKDKENDPAPEPEKPFDITEHFVAGTIGNSSYAGVFFIQFLEDDRALFIDSSPSNIAGNYTLTDTELVFEATGANERLAKFALDENKKITSATYSGAGPAKYQAVGNLLTVTESNQLAGKVFEGEGANFLGAKSKKTYDFHAKTATYGVGADAAEIDNTANNYILIGGSGFKHVNGSTVEIGFLLDRKLTTFLGSGLFYSGVHDQK